MTKREFQEFTSWLGKRSYKARLERRDVHLKPVGAAKLGYIHVRSGKSKNAKRNVSLTARVRAMLTMRLAAANSCHVFTDQTGTGPLSIYTLEDQHARVRKALGLSECVIHSFRHTFGTRLGEAGADAFTIMRVMGHSSVTVSQKYVHPTPEAMERAFERLEAFNERVAASLRNVKKAIYSLQFSLQSGTRMLNQSHKSFIINGRGWRNW